MVLGTSNYEDGEVTHIFHLFSDIVARMTVDEDHLDDNKQCSDWVRGAEGQE